MAGISAPATVHLRHRRGRAAFSTCHITLLHFPPTTHRLRILGNSLRANLAGGATPASLPAVAGGCDFTLAARPVIVAHAAPLAQLVEQLTLNQRVRGSKP